MKTPEITCKKHAARYERRVAGANQTVFVCPVCEQEKATQFLQDYTNVVKDARGPLPEILSNSPFMGSQEAAGLEGAIRDMMVDWPLSEFTLPQWTIFHAEMKVCLDHLRRTIDIFVDTRKD